MATEYGDNDVFNAYGVKAAEALSNTSSPRMPSQCGD
jgi:hypothetical protein